MFTTHNPFTVLRDVIETKQKSGESFHKEVMFNAVSNTKRPDSI